MFVQAVMRMLTCAGHSTSDSILLVTVFNSVTKDMHRSVNISIPSSDMHGQLGEKKTHGDFVLFVKIQHDFYVLRCKRK